MGHLLENGFEVKAVDVDDERLEAVAAEHGITAELASCHTAVVDGYVVEGHVPADLILKMLRERPQIAGLAVPGMPRGAPGMEGSVKDPYDVIAFDAQGETQVYARR